MKTPNEIRLARAQDLHARCASVIQEIESMISELVLVSPETGSLRYNLPDDAAPDLPAMIVRQLIDAGWVCTYMADGDMAWIDIVLPHIEYEATTPEPPASVIQAL